MVPPIYWVAAVGAVLLVGWFILLIGRALLDRIGRDSPARRRHGQYVRWWMLAGWLVGGMYGVFHGPLGIYVCGMFGMLGGWAVGMIHGAVVLVVWPDDPTRPPATP